MNMQKGKKYSFYKNKTLQFKHYSLRTASSIMKAVARWKRKTRQARQQREAGITPIVPQLISNTSLPPINPPPQNSIKTNGPIRNDEKNTPRLRLNTRPSTAKTIGNTPMSVQLGIPRRSLTAAFSSQITKNESVESGIFNTNNNFSISKVNHIDETIEKSNNNGNFITLL